MTTTQTAFAMEIDPTPSPEWIRRKAAQDERDERAAAVEQELARRAEARIQAKAARAERNRKKEVAKCGRRFDRNTKAIARRADQTAVCGISFYSRCPRDRDIGNYWRTCSRCGQPLQWFDTYEEAQAHNTGCHRPTPTETTGPQTKEPRK